MLTKQRTIKISFLGTLQPEGKGATVRRSIGRPELQYFDPFLMLDEIYIEPPAGFPDHPHRGFETVSYVLDGQFKHEDSCGHKGVIESGDLQWMTAGRGIVHAEMPGRETHGLQLWVNLPAKEKMCEPKYQELLDRDIKRVSSEEGVVIKVIAGESFGVRSQVYTKTPTMYLDIQMEAGKEIKQQVPSDWNAFIYTLEGDLELNQTVVRPHYTVAYHQDGDHITIKSMTKARLLLIAGQPLNEPVVHHGPFVMNTKEELMEAFMDYQMGRNGFEKAHHWQSQIGKAALGDD